jgi:hypothetical protein
MKPQKSQRPNLGTTQVESKGCGKSQPADMNHEQEQPAVGELSHERLFKNDDEPAEAPSSETEEGSKQPDPLLFATRKYVRHDIEVLLRNYAVRHGMS